MTHQEIKQKLPHRWPFLFVDKITKIDTKSIEGYKNVSASDIVFVGHFPEVSIFPGVIIVEALAQLSGLFLSAQSKDTKISEATAKIGFLTSIRNFKFVKTVEPGDQLFLKSILKGNNEDYFIFSVSAYVDKQEVAAGEIQLFLQQKELVL
ncbi:MAG: 3-hydroxyacyl-ACP dehydratase FabZ [Clostridiales bacterium]|jgi:3-hydroxyacyl-[acyl-carrier-protein] dehydratase|nr:3-hydroxyacyl-ACP dehydratase FabZ [Clostridiales bacterium]